MELKIISVNEIQPNPFQPRESFENESLKELADSIKNASVIQPIVVRRHGKGYQIVAGERRWRAANLVGIKEIPALIKDVSEEDVLLESLIENLHRENLKSVEEEKVVYELWKTERWKTYAELGKAFGKTESWVTSHIQAKRIRDETVHAHPSISTRTIHDVAGLEKEDREIVLEKVGKGEIKTPEVRDYARVIKKASITVKRELLKPKSRVTPKMAETIVTKLPREEEQILVIDEIKRSRLTEDEVVDRVKEVQNAREMGKPLTREMGVKEGTVYSVGEYECPHCKKHYLIKCNGKQDWIE